MFEKMFMRHDVCDFINELFAESYNNKKKDSATDVCNVTNTQEILFTFFDALFKYQIIIETDIFLDEYIVQVKKLFKKVNNFHDINLGISKIIGKFCALKFNIADRENEVSKREILQYVYHRYIVEGYFFHGFSGVYKEQIQKNGFVPEKYQHSYANFIEVNKIFSKHNYYSVIKKSFDEKYVSFTDNFMMACFYGVNAPMYFYNLLGGYADIRGSDLEAYFRNDYLACFNNLNKLMKSARLSDSEKKYITKVCLDEWKVLHKGSSNINIMMIKRKVLGLNCLRDINEILNSDCDLGDGIFKILSSKSDDIPVGYKIDSFNIEFIEIPNYKVLFDLREKQIYEITSKNRLIKKHEERLSNTYGKVTFLVLLGSLLITLGVIISIITVSKGI